MRSVASFILALAAVISVPAHAESVAKGGHVNAYWVFEGTNYAFRVSLDVAAPECGDGFFYTNVADDNYQAYVSALLSAAMNHKAITIYAEKVSGYCHIQSYFVNLTS